MNLERVTIRLDKLTKRPFVARLCCGQQEALISVLGPLSDHSHPVKPSLAKKLIGASPAAWFRKVTRAATVPLIGDIRSVPEEIPTRQRIE